MRETAMVIANPAASGFTGADFRKVCAILAERYDIEEHWPESPTVTHQLSLEAVAREVGAVFAMGGDGVVHHSVQGLIGSDVPVGIIPSGTTNVLSRIVGLPGRPSAAARRLLEAEPRPMPTIRAEIRRGNGDIVVDHAIFALGFGFDASVVIRAESKSHRKRSLGGLHYAMSTVNELRGYNGKRPHGTIEVGGEEVDCVAAQVQIHDVYTYFGRVPLHIGPPPGPAMTVTTYSRLGPTVIGPLALGALSGERMERVRGARIFTDISSFRITARNEDLHTQADGEGLGVVASVVVSHEPDSYLALG